MADKTVQIDLLNVQRVKDMQVENERLRAEVKRLHSWAGIMSLLDEHYPDATYPTLPDRKGRDAGPRIISLVRTVDVLRAELARLTAAPLPATDPAVTNWTAVEGVLAGREADGNSYVRIADVRAAWVGTGVAT